MSITINQQLRPQQSTGEQQDKKTVVDINNDHEIIVKQTVLEEYGYNISKYIGAGSYAKVKLAYSENHKCNVAIKIISKFNTPKDIIAKFVPREIEVVKGLVHDHLIRFYQSIETTHRFYIIMEYAENGSLLDFIREHKYLTEFTGQKFFKQLISVIDYCHQRDIVHRDIKCENLLLDKWLNIKLIDFGFARKLDNGKEAQSSSITSSPLSSKITLLSSTFMKDDDDDRDSDVKPPTKKILLSNTFCGSYAYASPEILKGIPYEPKLADIWAAGVALYAMIYGRLPFDDSNYKRLVKQVHSKVLFPKDILTSTKCKQLIKNILNASLDKRFRIEQIKIDIWLTGSIENITIADAITSITDSSIDELILLEKTINNNNVDDDDDDGDVFQSANND